jgi:2-C-methyl-D-erythritol 4-phosphate cytidylyltransferase
MNFTTPKFAVIVAGGSGTRMGTETPKQFLLLQEKPLLMHTLQRFSDYPEKIEIILVLPEYQFPFWKKLCADHHFTIPHKIVAGGQTRFESVNNGLKEISTEGLVAIHDGVRPFVTKKIIQNTFESAEKYGNGVASIALKDSIRSIKKDLSHAEDRNAFRLIQTPQTFKISEIKKAFQKVKNKDFSDDASVLETAGGKIILTEGSYENIKITTPEDMIIAEAIAKKFLY